MRCFLIRIGSNNLPIIIQSLVLLGVNLCLTRPIHHIGHKKQSTGTFSLVDFQPAFFATMYRINVSLQAFFTTQKCCCSQRKNGFYSNKKNCHLCLTFSRSQVGISSPRFTRIETSAQIKYETHAIALSLYKNKGITIDISGFHSAA